MMSEFSDNPLTDLHDDMLSNSLAAKFMFDEIYKEEDSNKAIDPIEEFKISKNILPFQLREIRRDVFRNIADELANSYNQSSELEELHDIFTEYDLFPINIKIKNEDLYLDPIEHYVRIINSPLSDLIGDYKDITQIKSFLTKNKIKEADLISMYQSYINYSTYFRDCFDDIHKLEDKFIVMGLIKESSMMWDANQLSLSWNEDLGIENPFDCRRVERNLLECFNIQKINNYWGLLDQESDYLDYDIFSLDTALYSKKIQQQFNFEKLKPDFNIKENSVAAIWYLAIIHGILDGNFDERESMLLVNTMKISVAIVSKVNEKYADNDNSSAEDWIHRDNELLMDYRTNKLSSISEVQVSELWEAYHCAADKITDPELHAFTIAICIWISQGDLSEIQNQGIGKLSFRWYQFDNDSVMFWLDEINAYANGEKG
tara:strand:+ start:9371 stop:10663 length:1293 start_codon:yes stop_codon:yes gene_type:complete